MPGSEKIRETPSWLRTHPSRSSGSPARSSVWEGSGAGDASRDDKPLCGYRCGSTAVQQMGSGRVTAGR
jgi:hypothetical protein